MAFISDFNKCSHFNPQGLGSSTRTGTALFCNGSPSQLLANSIDVNIKRKRAGHAYACVNMFLCLSIWHPDSDGVQIMGKTDCFVRAAL